MYATTACSRANRSHNSPAAPRLHDTSVPSRSSSRRRTRQLLQVLSTSLLFVRASALGYQRIYPATTFGHNLGSQIGGSAWAVTTADRGDYVLLGPYEGDVPLNTKLCAWFHLSIDDATSDLHGVAMLDVASRGSVLNKRYVQRQHFNAANSVQAFSVCFTSPSSNPNMEYRMWTPGGFMVV